MVHHPSWLNKVLPGRQIIHSQHYQEYIWLFALYPSTGVGLIHFIVVSWCMMHNVGSGRLVGRIPCSLSIFYSPRISLCLLSLYPNKMLPQTVILVQGIPPFHSRHNWMAKLLWCIAYPVLPWQLFYTFSYYALHIDCGNVAGGATSPILLILQHILMTGIK